ncbi:glutamyl aminopeptidase-like [Odontomachus brunneus]|uniref:glutamyl aminopeptidase-like n=1 Tax=Odontomachus brunneus TaxID=486640 RepID=UPI0013F21B5F|nr:glutamyl aminopeptidase-like [Odontomachus brunneus]
MSSRNTFMDPLKLLLSSILILTVTKAELVLDQDQLSNVDIENCLSVSPDERLPVDKIRPIKYTMKFIINPVLSKITGETNITITVDNPTRNISLHAYGLRVRKSSIELRNTESTESYKLLDYRYCSGPQILDMRFGKIIASGIYNITMQFTVSYSSQKGIFRYNYRKYARLSRMITTQLEPNAARRVFPCWDEPGIKAIFAISVKHPTEYNVFSNMPRIGHHSDEESDDNLLWTHFQDTLSMSASHVLIMLTDINFKYTNLYHSDTIWHQIDSEKTLKHAFLAIATAKTFWHMVTDTNTLFPKIDNILFPNNTINTMGCFGLTIYREKDFLYDASLDFPGRRNAVMKTIGHKIARQWFIGIVTPSWWTDLWLGEALATLYGYYTMDMFAEVSASMNLFVVQILQPTLRCDTDLQMKAISVHNVNNADEIDIVLYSQLYYAKGVALLRMLEYSLSREIFEQAVRKYLKTYELGSATVDNFWTILQSVYDQQNNHQNYTIKELMETWLTQKYYPVLYVDSDERNKVIRLTVVGTDDSNINNWTIPVTYTTMLYNNFYISNVTWINSSETTNISLHDYNLVIINTNQNGYYRVNYDKKSWLIIAEYLNYRDYKRIHVLNRAQILDDVYYFMMKREVPTSLFWEIIRYLQRETDYVAWYPMFNILSYMSPYWNLPGSAFIKPVMLEILDGLLKNIGYEEIIYENDMSKSLRLLGTRWACKLGHTTCLSIANVKLAEHLKNPDKHKILPWWKDWVYCTGMIAANITIWDKLLEKYVATKDLAILDYLQCSEDEHIISRYLQLLMSNQENWLLNDEKFINIYRALVRKHARKNVVLENILKRYDMIRYRFLSNIRDIDIFGDMIMNVHFDEQFDKIIRFIESQTNMLSLNMSEIYLLRETQKERSQKLMNTFIF